MPKASLPACIMLCNCCVAVFAAQTGSLYDSGLEQYRSGHYKQAARDFLSASRQEPAKQDLHYLLANCFVHLGQNKRAVEEYEAAYYINPASNTADYCKQALLSYKIVLPEPASLPKSSGIACGELDQAKSLIKTQARFEKDKHGQVAARSTALIQNLINDEIKRIDWQMQADIQKLYEPLIFTPGPRANLMLAFPELLKEREAQIRQAAQAEKARLAENATSRKQVYETWKKNREALLDQTVDNLQDQLDKPAGPSGIKLQAHGTGLYVRNYKITGPSRVPETHAATARFGEISKNEDAAESSAATKDDSQQQVKGTLLKETEQLKLNMIRL